MKREPGLKHDEGRARGSEFSKTRVKNKEILVVLTDKSGNLCMVTPEAYETMGEIHTSKDEKVEIHEVEKTQKILIGHINVVKMF